MGQNESGMGGGGGGSSSDGANHPPKGKPMFRLRQPGSAKAVRIVSTKPTMPQQAQSSPPSEGLGGGGGVDGGGGGGGGAAAASREQSTHVQQQQSNNNTNNNNNNHHHAHDPHEGMTTTTTPAAPPPPINTTPRDFTPVLLNLKSPHSLVASSELVGGDGDSKVIKLQRILACDKIDPGALADVCWSGLPFKYRPTVWRLLLGYMPLVADRREATMARQRSDYHDCVPEYFSAVRSDYEDTQWKQILVDLPRTNPSLDLCRLQRVQDSLQRILYVWAIRHPGTGYVQGINDLATVFFYLFLAEFLGPEAATTGDGLDDMSAEAFGIVEADTYQCLTRMLDFVQENYVFAQKGIQRKIFELKRLVRKVDAPLHDHLEKEGIDFLEFAIPWMNCLLLRELSLPCVLRVWDAYVAEGQAFPAFHVYVCTAFVHTWSAEIQRMEYTQALTLLQSPPAKDWDVAKVEMLLGQAFQWRALFNRSQAHLEN